MSHPTWVRGLKHSMGASGARKLESHPTWVRGLKLFKEKRKPPVGKSHPTWVRGLKHTFYKVLNPQASRTLRGCVD